MDTTSQTTATRGNVPAIAWGLAPVAWVLLLMGWLALDGDLSGPAQTALGIAILALPAPWLLWASWRMPRPRVATYLAEGGALAAMLLSLLVTAVYFLLGSDPAETAPVGFTAAFLAAAAVLVAASWPLPGRRIAYGAAALACLAFAVTVQVPALRTGAYQSSALTLADEVLVNVLLGAIVVGALGQIAWWLRSRHPAA
ncbi:hypothetical protein [Glycomyces terrestris]|uniref:Uncharacterized protein n=1 Tax=Glycomyces terrestris TaxID=2493553 RepID=A0A426UVV2_9ACTN|nr:hypothetical protein [Glycomyces terrestris]RRR98476.1 hypothetical protein EIW28_16465 [Glycomyces terrestris]